MPFSRSKTLRLLYTGSDGSEISRACMIIPVLEVDGNSKRSEGVNSSVMMNRYRVKNQQRSKKMIVEDKLK